MMATRSALFSRRRLPWAGAAAVLSLLVLAACQHDGSEGLTLSEIFEGTPQPVRASKHMIVAGHPLAAEAGLDMLRAGGGTEGFVESWSVSLVEISPGLKTAQEDALVGAKDALPVRTLQWWSDFSEVPEGPLLLVANEFLDALPVRQFQKTSQGWRERMVGVSDDQKEFRFILADGPPEDGGLPPHLSAAGAGDGVETVASLLALDDASMSAVIDDYQRGFTWLRDPRILSVAAVQGYAVGAGFQLALSCDLRVLAEGVETLEQEQLLKQLGCQRVQGFYYSKPIPLAEFEQKYLLPQA